MITGRRFLVHGVLALAAGGFLLLGPTSARRTNTIHLVGTAALYCLTVIGVNIVFGFAGQITLGPAATFAVGAYVGGVLSSSPTGTRSWPSSRPSSPRC